MIASVLVFDSLVRLAVTLERKSCGLLLEGTCKRDLSAHESFSKPSARPPQTNCRHLIRIIAHSMLTICHTGIQDARVISCVNKFVATGLCRAKYDDTACVYAWPQAKSAAHKWKRADLPLNMNSICGTKMTASHPNHNK